MISQWFVSFIDFTPKRGRLAAGTHSGGNSETAAYDPNGNLTSLTRTGTRAESLVYTYTSGTNKLGTLKSNGTNKTYAYNADGTVKNYYCGFVYDASGEASIFLRA